MLGRLHGSPVAVGGVGGGGAGVSDTGIVERIAGGSVVKVMIVPSGRSSKCSPITATWSATKSATLRSNCPLPWTPKIVTFAYVDPGHQTDTELYSWGAAHGPLWDALRKKGRQVRVIGIAVENAILDRTDRVLETWAAADPGTSDEGLTPKQEINAIRAAMRQSDHEFLAQYGGFGKAMKRAAALYKLPEANLTERKPMSHPPSEAVT